MKKKIAILGSTGSIGKNLLEIVKKNKKEIEIVLLTANKDYKNLLLQAKKFNVKNLIITNPESYEKLKNKTIRSNIKIYNNFENLEKILKTRIDYVMNSIIGIDGLQPTLNIIKFTKKIAIANKESIICGWNLIKRKCNKSKTEFIPIDSEHFSLWMGIRSQQYQNIEQIFITASGGPFINKSLKSFKNIKISEALKHPTWKMGKKISIDSATMINKVYEVIEAKNIFNIPYDKIQILTHPKSYVHAIVKFNNGIIKLIAHDTTMKIPIFNSIYLNEKKNIKSGNLNLNHLNSLKLKKVDLKKFPMIKILQKLPVNTSLFETVIVAANDTLVDLFLNKKIKFLEIQKLLFEIIKDKKFIKFKKIHPRNVSEILILNNYVRSKILKKVYK